jgi:N-acetylneuraminate synthase
MIKICDKIIGKDSKPFIIAEMSGNHNQSLERALEIVAAAAATGVDAIKLQTYTPDTMTLNIAEGDFFIDDKNSIWNGRFLYELYAEAHTPWDWHEPIFEKCKELGLIYFSTPFDATSVDFLETLDVPCYKIASFENTDIPLLKKVAKTGKPVIISTGLANLSEIKESVKTLKDNGCNEIVLLKCTSSYPANPENTNILTIWDMKKLFPDCEIGLSDHTMGIGVSVASVALGATVLEKHFTLSRDDGGVDSDFSMEPLEMKQLVIEAERAFQSLGKVTYEITEKEKASLKFKRSLYFSKDLKQGDLITEDNLRVIRPGFGLAPKFYEFLLGKKVNIGIKKGTPACWGLISGGCDE